MNFGLPCTGGNSDTCNNGLQGSWEHDKDGNKTAFDPVSIGNKNGQLVDVSSNNTGVYTASFNGSNVSLTNSSGNTQNGSWLQGTDPVKGVSGGGALSNKFSFDFYDHGKGQLLNASFTYQGTFGQAENELAKAGYNFSVLDQSSMSERWWLIPMRLTSGHRQIKGTGSNSGHALMDLVDDPYAHVPTVGSIHTGETNWTKPFGAAWQHGTKEQ